MKRHEVIVLTSIARLFERRQLRLPIRSIMTQMDSNLGERLVKFETFFTSKDPEVVSASAQLSFPPGASFGRMDFNPDVLAPIQK